MEKIYKVLVLCTSNSARSILAEVLFNALGHGRFEAYSAGSQPVGAVNPGALEWLQHQGYATENLRSKSWDEFATSDAPEFDLVITVCDNIADASCPTWQGQPVTAHWSLPDPAAVEGKEVRRAAFNHVAEQLAQRIHLLMSLPLGKLDKLSLHSYLQAFR